MKRTYISVCVIMTAILILMTGCIPKKNNPENQTKEQEQHNLIQEELTSSEPEMNENVSTVATILGSDELFGGGEEEDSVVYPTETTPTQQTESTTQGQNGVFGNGEEENTEVKPTETTPVQQPESPTQGQEGTFGGGTEEDETESPASGNHTVDQNGMFGGAAEEE